LTLVWHPLDCLGFRKCKRTGAVTGAAQDSRPGTTELSARCVVVGPMANNASRQALTVGIKLCSLHDGSAAFAIANIPLVQRRVIAHIFRAL